MEQLIHHENVGSLVPVDEKPEKPTFAIDDTLKTALNNLCDKAEKQNDHDWLTAKKGMVKCRKYFDNKQYGYVNDQCQWQDYSKNPGEVTHVDNAYQYFIQTALTELSRSKTDLAFSHVSDTREGKLIARIAESRYKTHKRKLFPAIKVQQENLSLLLNGLAARYTYFDKSGRDEKIPVFGESNVSGMSTVVCAICKAPRGDEQGEGQTDEVDTCQKCGSVDVETLDSGETNSKVITGYETGACYGNDWEPVDPLGLNFFLAASSVKETPYIIWKQVILVDVLQDRFKDAKIKEGIQSNELRDQYDSSNSSPFAHLSSGGDKNVAEFTQAWFDLPMYANIELKEAVTLRNGVTIPAGTKMGKAFPKGLYIARNEKNILDVWSEDKNEKWTIAPYVSRLGTMVGAGTSVALGNQDIKNDLRNLHMASIMHDAFAKEFVNMQYIEGESIPNDPTERAIVTNLPDGQKIVGTVIDRLPATSLSSDAYGLEERVDQSMQSQIGAFSVSGAGAPDLKAVQDTASGLLAYREMAVGRYGPMLEVKADALDREQAYQFLINDQRGLTPEQWEKVKGDYGTEALKLFLACDLREELIIEVVADSYMPQSPGQKQGQMMAFGQFIAETQIPPNSEMGAYAGRMYQIPQHLLGFESQYDTARAHLEIFKQVAEMIVSQFGDVPTSDINDPRTEQLAMVVLEQSNVPVDPEMDNIEAMIDSFKDWWGTDAGRVAPNLLKAAVSLRVKMLKGGTAELAAENMQLEMAAQAPAIEQQQAQADQQMQAQQAEQMANQDAEAQKMMVEQQRKDADDERADANKLLDLANQAEERAVKLKLADKNAKTATAK